MIKYSAYEVLNRIYNFLGRLIGYSEASIDADEEVDAEGEDNKAESFSKTGKLSHPGDIWRVVFCLKFPDSTSGCV